MYFTLPCCGQSSSLSLSHSDFPPIHLVLSSVSTQAPCGGQGSSKTMSACLGRASSRFMILRAPGHLYVSPSLGGGCCWRGGSLSQQRVYWGRHCHWCRRSDCLSAAEVDLRSVSACGWKERPLAGKSSSGRQLLPTSLAPGEVKLLSIWSVKSQAWPTSCTTRARAPTRLSSLPPAPTTGLFPSWLNIRQSISLCSYAKPVLRTIKVIWQPQS